MNNTEWLIEQINKLLTDSIGTQIELEGLGLTIKTPDGNVRIEWERQNGHKH